LDNKQIAFEEGKKTALEGKSSSECPYEFALKQSWIEGFSFVKCQEVIRAEEYQEAYALGRRAFDNGHVQCPFEDEILIVAYRNGYKAASKEAELRRATAERMRRAEEYRKLYLRSLTPTEKVCWEKDGF
jgi:ribosome modulation factor